jgi:hypothetical protein
MNKKDVIDHLEKAGLTGRYLTHNEWQGDLEYKAAQTKGLFPLGRIMSTPAAMAALNLEEPGDTGAFAAKLLGRHVTGDWGDVEEEDVAVNNRAVTNASRIHSVYRLPSTQKDVWIMTEGDRSHTAILMPEEY